MADDYDDGSAEVFMAVVAFLILGVVTGVLIYNGVIHDWKTAGAAIGILILYVVVSNLVAPYVIAAAPTKSQSGYDQGNFGSRNIIGQPTLPRNQRIPPAGYLFAVVMPGYFIGQGALWLWRLIFRSGDEAGKKK